MPDHVGNDRGWNLAVGGDGVHRHLLVLGCDEEELTLALDAFAEFDVVYA